MWGFLVGCLFVVFGGVLRSDYYFSLYCFGVVLLFDF